MRKLKQFFKVLILLFFVNCQDKEDFYQRVSGKVFGTTYSVIYQGRHEFSFDSIFDKINGSLSTYIVDSDISKINRGDNDIVVDENFKAVFQKAKEIWEKTDGFFDPTVGSLLNAWGFGKNNSRFQFSQNKIDSLLLLTGFDKVKITEQDKISKENPNIKINFNALAKGYGVDMLGVFLDSKGIENYLIEIGGELLAKGQNTLKKKNWLVGVDHPKKSTLSDRNLITKIALKNRGMATSGNYRKFKTNPNTGEKYSHIINPKTGYSYQSNVLSATVLSSSCMKADAYATAFMILPWSRIKLIVELQEDLEVFIVIFDAKGRLETKFTDGFKTFMQ